MPSSLPHIPTPYRVLLLYLEPFFALNGAILCFFAPTTFLNTFSPHLRYSPDSQIIYDQLAATYLLFAFNQLVVLRISQDIRVWRAIVGGILLCDVVHFWAGLKVMGLELFARPWLWRPEDWIALVTLIVPGSMRVAFLLGVGVKEQERVMVNGGKKN